MAMAPVRNMNRFEASSNGAALTSGVLTAVGIQLGAGVTVKNISFVTATTAAGTPTHWGVAAYSNDAVPALKGASADQTTTAMPANTLITKALAVPFVIPKTGWYWFGLWVTATTVPTLLSAPAFTSGLLNTSGILATDKALAVTSGTGLTTAPPATIATGGTVSLTVPLIYVS